MSKNETENAVSEPTPEQMALLDQHDPADVAPIEEVAE